MKEKELGKIWDSLRDIETKLPRNKFEIVLKAYSETLFKSSFVAQCKEELIK